MRRRDHEVLWRLPAELLGLGDHEVHLWRASLDLPAPVVHALEQTLAADEQQRASQFRFARDRTRFIAARGALRSILARYLRCAPQAIQFRYNEYGKPALVQAAERGPLFFNLAHAHNLALYAITRSGEIGVDLEPMTPSSADYERVAERFFSPDEVRRLQAVRPESKQEAFLNCWTRKEAYIKARGLGLSLDLRLFDVSLTPGEPAALLAVREQGQDSACWSLYDLAPGPGYIGALAVKGHPTAITCWQWQAAPSAP